MNILTNKNNMKNKDIHVQSICREGFVGVLYFEGRRIIPKGEDFWGSVMLHFGEKLGKDALWGSKRNSL